MFCEFIMKCTTNHIFLSLLEQPTTLGFTYGSPFINSLTYVFTRPAQAKTPDLTARTNHHVLTLSLLVPPGRQDSDAKSFAENWPSPLRPTLSTGTRQQKPKWKKSVVWPLSSTRSSSKTSNRRRVRVKTHATAKHLLDGSQCSSVRKSDYIP